MKGQTLQKSSDTTSADIERPNFGRIFRRKLAVMSFGIFGALFTLGSASDVSLDIQRPSVPAEAAAPQHDKREFPSANVQWKFSLGIDCNIAPNLGQKAKSVSWTSEAYRPLGMSLKEQGAGSEPYMFIGQRAPGAKEGGPLSNGWVFGFDKGKQSYVLYSFRTENKQRSDEAEKLVHDNEQPSEAVPFVVTQLVKSVSIGEIQQGITSELDGMVLGVSYSASSPDAPLHFDLRMASQQNC